MDSAEQYRTPTVCVSGRICFSRPICSFTGVRSEEPVTLPPGASLLATSFASAGSVTAVTRTGISVVCPATACAAGVAIARIRSFLSFTSLVAMV